MDRHSILDMGNLLLAQERERFLARTLVKHGITSLDHLRVFDAGCSTGYNLRLMVQWGARPQHLAGMDIDAEAIASFAALSPEIRGHTGSAEDVPEPDQAFDLSLAFTLFGSVFDEDVAAAIARELFRITKPGGLIVVYDVRRKNLGNPGTHAVDEDDIRRWFPKCPLRMRSISVASPLAHIVGRYAPWLYGALAAIPPLRSHAFCVLRRPATSPFT